VTRSPITYGTYQPGQIPHPLEVVSPRPGVLEVRTTWRDEVTVMATITDPDVHMSVEWTEGWIDNPDDWHHTIISGALDLYVEGTGRPCAD